MTDVLSKFSGTGSGSKGATEGSVSSDSLAVDSKASATSSVKPDVAASRGNDLLAGAKNADLAATGDAVNVGTVGTKETSKVEPNSAVTDPDTWTKESALYEAKKAREEAKATRLKYQETVAKLKEEQEARIAVIRAEQDALAKKAEEFDQLKAKEEDKKRDLSEKLAHREAVLSELKAKLDAVEKSYKDQLSVKESELAKYYAEAEVQQAVYRDRLEKELESIPEKYRELANVMVKGAGDPRDALTILHEAKLKSMFEDKTAIVVHNVPGAADGARATDERIQAGQAAERSKLSSSQKIAQGLKSIRSGQSNSMFRNR